MWASLTWLASHTQRIEFGPLVTPVSFRNPVFTARSAKDVSDLSGGRLVLGVGAGWQEREHANFGFELLGVRPRFKRFQESLEVITRLLRSDKPVSFAGEFYQLRNATLLPLPQQPGHPPILIGGNGRTLTLPLAARYADEWNSTFMLPEKFSALSKHLDELLVENGRRPGDVRRSPMTGIVFGRDDAEVQRLLSRRNSTADSLRERGVVVGTASAVTDQLDALAEAGVQRGMLQWLELVDLDRLEALARSLL